HHERSSQQAGLAMHVHERIDLYEIEAHHATSFGHALKQRPHLMVEQSINGWGACARRYRRIQAVDIDGHERIAEWRQLFEDGIDAALADVLASEYPCPGLLRVCDLVVAGAHVADSDLRHVAHERQLL